jgi:dihydropyrimidinase
LVLTDERYEQPDAERYLVVPPLRAAQHRDALWGAIAQNEIASIGSDHAQGPYRPIQHPRNFAERPYGFAGIEVRLPLLLSEGLRRGLPIELLVDRLSSGPARVFGLYPRKGAIAAGSDGDIVVWDPSERWTIQPNALHDGLADSPYRGLEVQGRVRYVLRHGEVVIDRGEQVAAGPPARYTPALRTVALAE